MAEVLEQPVVAGASESVSNVDEAIEKVLRYSGIHNGLLRGLHEVAKALEMERVEVCFMAEDCEEDAYKKLIKALCNEKNVPCVPVTERKTLGQWAGLCTIDTNGVARRVVGTSSVAVIDYGVESEAKTFLANFIKELQK
eukprot:Trichotokara_eunicae@DN2430_c0_g1_i1.p1